MTRRWAFVVFIIASLIGYGLGAFMHSEFFHFFANIFAP